MAPPSSAPAKKGKKRSSDRQIKKQSEAVCSGSLFTPLGQRRSARLKKKCRKIYLCNDVLYDVFAGVEIVQLGLGVALVSDHFDALVDNCFKTKKRKLRRLWIRQAMNATDEANDDNARKAGESELVTYECKSLPFAKCPPPNGFVGFKSISISYIDANALQFLEVSRPLFNDGIAFRCDGIFKNRVKPFRQIWPLFYPHIVKMVLTKDLFVRLRHLFGVSVLKDCAKLRFVNFDGIDLEAPSSDSSPGKSLFKWLHTPREDGRPKMLTTTSAPQQKQLEDLKKEFLSATSAVSFMIRFRKSSFFFDEFSDSLEQFDLSNALTGERLTLRHVIDEKRNNLGFDIDPDQSAGTSNKSSSTITAKFNIWLLERGPAKRDEQQWAHWAREGPFDTSYWEEDNVVYVNFDDRRQLGQRVRRRFCCCYIRRT